MRVNRPQWGMNPQMQGRGNMPQNTQNVSQNTQKQMPQKTPAGGESCVMQLARKIKSEQGEKSAGYFLYAMRPFVAPHEIAHIESVLNVRSERDMREQESKAQSQGNNMNMMQLMMQLMRGKSPDPMSLMKMMGKGAVSNQ